MECREQCSDLESGRHVPALTIIVEEATQLEGVFIIGAQGIDHTNKKKRV